MPAISEIGRVSIKVTPDTRGFRQTTKREVEAQLAGQDAELPIGVDAKDLRAKIAGAVRAAEKRNEANIGIDVNTSTLRAKLVSAIRIAERGLTAHVGVDVDRSPIEQISQSIDRSLRNSRINLPAKLDFDTRTLHSELDQLARDKRLRIQLLTDESKFKQAVLRAAKNASPVDLETRVDIDQNRLLRELSRLNRDQIQTNIFANNTARGLNPITRSISRIKQDIRSIIGDGKALTNAIRQWWRLLKATADLDLDRKMRLGPEPGTLNDLRRQKDLLDAIDKAVRRDSRMTRLELHTSRRLIEFEERRRDIAREIAGHRADEEAILQRIARAQDRDNQRTRDELGASRAVAEFEKALGRVRKAMQDIGKDLDIDKFLSKLSAGLPDLVTDEQLEQVKRVTEEIRKQAELRKQARSLSAGSIFDEGDVDRARKISDAQEKIVLRGREEVNLAELARQAAERQIDLGEVKKGQVQDILRRTEEANEANRRGEDVDNRRLGLLERMTRSLAEFAKKRRDLDAGFDPSFTGDDQMAERIRRSTEELRRFNDENHRVSEQMRRTTSHSSGFGRMFKTLGDSVGNVFRILNSGQGILKNLGGLFGSIAGPVGGLISGFGGLITQGALIVGVLGAISAALSLLGAAVTAAFGVITGLVAGIVAAVPVLGIAVGTVALFVNKLGEGKKPLEKIASIAKEAFAQIDKAVTAAAIKFDDQLQPVLRQLADVLLPSVTRGLGTVTDGLIVFAKQVAFAFQAAAEMGTLDAVFANTKTTLDSLGDSFKNIILAMLEMAGAKSALDPLTGLFDELSEGWLNAVRVMNGEGSLTAAFEGLEMILRAVSRAIVGLMENGLRGLIGMAPGLTAFTDSLTNFFGRFDWERLGAAVGNVFQGIGEALDAVDAKSIEAITLAFEALGDTFRDPVNQAAWTSFFESIPEWITLLTELGNSFTGLVGFVSDTMNSLGELSGAIGEKSDLGEKLAAAILDPSTLPEHRKIFEAQLAQEYMSMMDTLSNEDIIRFTDILNNGIANLDTVQGGEAMRAKIEEILANASPAAKEAAKAHLSTIIPDGLGENLEPGVKEALAPLPETVGTALEGLTPRAIEALSSLTPEILQKFADLSPKVQTEIGNLANAISIGLGAALAEGTAKVGEIKTLFQGAFEGLVPIVQAQTAAIAGAVQIGMDSVSASVVNHFGPGSQLHNAFVQGFGSLAPTVVTPAMAQIVSALTIGLQSLGASVTTMVGPGSAFQNAWIVGLTALPPLITLHMAAIVSAFEIGFQSVTATVLTQLQGPILEAFRLGFTGVSTVVTESFITINLAITTAMASMNLTVQTAMTTLYTTFVTALTQVISAVQADLDFMVNGIIRPMMTTIVTLTQTTMQQFTAAITNGMNQAKQVTQAGVEAMRAEVTKMHNQWFIAGNNAGQGLVNGINAKKGAAVAAARSLVNAVNAELSKMLEIGSPSRLWYRFGSWATEGFTNAIEDGVRNVVRAVRLIGEAANGEMAGQQFAFQGSYAADFSHDVNSDGFGGLTGALVQAMEGWEVNQNATGTWKMVQKQDSRRARRR